MAVNRCAKCGTQTEEGFILDRTHGAVLGAEWVEGVPDRSVLGGIKGLKKRRRFRVMTFRCPKCGFVESYTAEQVNSKWWRQ